MDQRKLGRYIASKRKELGYTQKEISNLLNVGEKTVSKWERGINAPDISILKKLSEVLNVSVVSLLSAEDIEEKKENTYNVIGGLIFYNNLTKIKYIRILVISIFIVVFLFLLLFSINNYNNFKVFSISSDSKKYDVSGILVYNPERNIMFINNIDILDNNIGSNKEKTIKYLSIRIEQNNKVILTKNYDIENDSRLNDYLVDRNIYIDEPNNKDYIFSKTTRKLKINVEYITQDDDLNKISIPLKLVSVYSNNKLFY